MGKCDENCKHHRGFFCNLDSNLTCINFSSFVPIPPVDKNKELKRSKCERKLEIAMDFINILASGANVVGVNFEASKIKEKIEEI